LKKKRGKWNDIYTVEDVEFAERVQEVFREYALAVSRTLHMPCIGKGEHRVSEETAAMVPASGDRGRYI
jgi:hypothetical protein